MKIAVTWNPGGAPMGLASDMSFIATTESGHLVAMDGAPAASGEPIGGKNLAPRPMELVLAGTGGCTAYDVVLILKRGRHDVHACTVQLDAERAPSDPKVFTKIHFNFVVTGHALRAEVVERAIALSHDKYCSASVMLGQTATLTYGFQIIDRPASSAGAKLKASTPSSS